ncbi:MAG: T9SS type A sorting domain-containing protein [Nonlabens sp.]
MRNFYLILIIVVPFFTGNAQCFYKHIPLTETAADSKIIVEAQVVAHQGRKDAGDSMIKTVHELRVSRVFKGNITGNSIELVTLGGVFNGEFNLVTSAVPLKKGQTGIFFLSESGNGDYLLTHDRHGLIKYSQSEFKASRYEQEWFNIPTTLHPALEQLTGRASRSLGVLDFKFSAGSNITTLNITNISPLVSIAGVGQVLTITGSGFGTTRGNGEVSFRDANDGGVASVPSLDTQYISWSDTQIEVEIPSGAGTGRVDVVPNGRGTVFNSAQTLQILANHTNFIVDVNGVDYAYEIRLANDNGNNGYTWNYQDALVANSDARLTVDDSFQQWRCTTGRNFVRGTDLAGGNAANTSNASGSDTINIVKFDTGEIPTNSSTLGFLSTKGAVCNSSPPYIAFATELDFVINDETNFHFRDTPTMSLNNNEIDFRSVANHELGHAQLLGHVLDSDEVMFFSISNGVTRRDISQNDQQGALIINQRSRFDQPSCSPGPMTFLDCDFVYDNNEWTPFDPSKTSNQEANITVVNGTGPITDFVRVRNVTTQSSGTLQINSNGSEFRIYGDVVNNGAITTNSLNIVSTERTQQISGNPITTDLLISDVNTNVTLNTTILVRTGIGIQGTLNTNGNLRLLSDAMGTAVVPAINTITTSINGDVVTERYYSPNRAFRFLSSSVNTTTTIFQNWQNNGVYEDGIGTFVTGGLVANGFDQTVTNNPSLFTYDNSQAGTAGWNAVASTNNLLTNLIVAGNPYRIFIRGDREPRLLTNNNAPNDTRIVTTGTLQLGPVTDNSISNVANRFSFTGNPLHAPIDMELVLTRPGSNLRPSYYIWDPNAASVGKYIAINTLSNTNDDPTNSDATKFAQIQQAFFVQTDANAAASITFEETDKTFNVNPAVNRSNTLNHIYGVLYEEQEFLNDGRRQDSFNMTFDSSFSSAIDGFDTEKLENISESISIVTGSASYAIQQRAMPVDSEVIQLRHTNYQSTDYVYAFDLSGLDGLEVSVFDNYLNTSQPLARNAVSSFSFQVDPNIPGSLSSTRFSLVFENTTLSTNGPTASLFNLYPNPANNAFTVGLKNPGPASLTIYSATGQQLFMQSLESRETQISTDLPTGYYLVQIIQGNYATTEKLIIK